jgi:hypothetical protein
MRFTTIVAAAAAPLALGAVLLGTAGQASAAVVAPAAVTLTAQASGTVTAHTHQNGVADTTDVSGPGTTDSPGGPVWAYDNLERTITATPLGGNQWQVTVGSQGSYKAFADPRTGQAWDGNGPVKGTVTYQVTTTGTPDARNLGGQSDPALHSGDLISALFGGASLQVTGSSYNFTYQLNGQPYSQAS